MSELIEVKPDIKKVTVITTFLTAAIIMVLLWLDKIPWEISNNIFSHLTMITVAINIFFGYLSKYCGNVL